MITKVYVCVYNNNTERLLHSILTTKMYRIARVRKDTGQGFYTVYLDVNTTDNIIANLSWEAHRRCGYDIPKNIDTAGF